MIFSLIVYNKWSQYMENQKKREKENFTLTDAKKKLTSNSIVSSFFTLLAVSFFIMEGIAMYYSIMLAIKCTKPGAERIINLILAVTVTLPYILSNILFNKCIMDTLKINNSPWVHP